MNKFLPRNITNSSGFTLVELMVVIAIIAILATIGASIFFNTQSRVRDGARQANINQLAKSIEATKDPNSAPLAYAYSVNNYNNDFPGKLIDPQGGTNVICIKAGVAQTPTAFTTACTSAGAGWAELVSAAGAPTAMTATTTGWTVCVAQENNYTPPGGSASSNAFFCKSSTR